jgi:hypothetical protein
VATLEGKIKNHPKVTRFGETSMKKSGIKAKDKK